MNFYPFFIHSYFSFLEEKYNISRTQAISIPKQTEIKTIAS